MLFSIIIPVYNKEKYIDNCIASVLKQTEHDFEIVLLDDGSTDRSAEICDEYISKYSFISVIHKKNEGLMMTRRKGFSAASGEFFLCVDSDDYLLDNRVLVILKQLFDKYQCDIIQFEWENRQADGKVQKKDDVFSESIKLFDSNNMKEIREKLCLSKMNSLCCRAYSKEIIDVDCDYSHWKKAICRGEDIFQSFALFDRAKKVLYYGKQFYCYSWNADSISFNPKIEFYDAYRATYTRKDQYMDKWGIDETIKTSIHKNQTHHLAKLIVMILKKADNKEKKNKWKQYIRQLKHDSFTSDRYIMAKELNALKYDKIVLYLASKGLPGIIIAVSRIRNIKNRLFGHTDQMAEFY